MPRGTRQVVTKVVVNEKINLPREQRQHLRLEVLNGVPDELSASLKGRINWLGYLNSQAADNLWRLLNTEREGDGKSDH
jgi:hypothetical protein